MSTITFQTNRRLPIDSKKFATMMTNIMGNDNTYKKFKDFLFGLQLEKDFNRNEETISLDQFLITTGK